MLPALVHEIGNGIGSGIIMTLGADAAPRDHSPRFLSIWRVMTDLGNAGGPIPISLLARAVSSPIDSEEAALAESLSGERTRRPVGYAWEHIRTRM